MDFISYVMYGSWKMNRCSMLFLYVTLNLKDSGVVEKKNSFAVSMTEQIRP